jgi:Glycine zipper 2TM domain
MGRECSRERIDFGSAGTGACPTWPLLVVAAAVLAGCGGHRAPGNTDTLGAANDSLVAIADMPATGDTLHGAASNLPPPPPPPPAPSPKPATRHPAPAVAAAPPAPTPPADVTPAPVARHAVLAVGTSIETVAVDSIHSHITRPGDVVRVRVAQDMSDGGEVIIPEGAEVTLVVDSIAPAPHKGARATLVLSARNIVIAGTTYPLDADVPHYQFEMKTRSIGASEVAKTGAGAVVGGVLGRLIGGNKTGTVVGAAGGAAAGAVVASKTIDQDIIVHAGDTVTVTLQKPFAH